MTSFFALSTTEGCAQEFIYNDILPILGKGTDVRTVAKKVGVDMGFISPLICIPSECQTVLVSSVNSLLAHQSSISVKWRTWSRVFYLGTHSMNHWTTIGMM